MIVRDEAENIERLLRSVHRAIDYAVIVDTGSVDDTVQIIERLFEQLGLAGKVYHREWTNFATARNQALELARPHADYVIALDADWEMEIEDPQVMRRLTGPWYAFRIEDGGRFHDNERILRTDIDWRWVHPVHEQPEADGVTEFERLPGVIAHVQSVGSFKTRRFERDIELLEAELEKDPDDEHALFYLANSLRSAGRHDEMVACYKRLVELDTPTTRPRLRMQRQYFALKALGDVAQTPELKLQWWERATQLLPHRLETAHKSAVLLRETGKPEQAWRIASKRTQFPVPDDPIGVIPDLYEWTMAIEALIAAELTGRSGEAQAIARQLVAVPSIPEPVRQQLEAALSGA